MIEIKVSNHNDPYMFVTRLSVEIRIGDVACRVSVGFSNELLIQVADKKALLKQVYHSLMKEIDAEMASKGVAPTLAEWKFMEDGLYKKLEQWLYPQFYADGKPWAPEMKHTQHIHSNHESVSPIVQKAPHFELLSRALPGVEERVKYPCTCSFPSGMASLRRIIMHLNDYHRWTRNAIADWLESLDVDLEFKTVDTPLRRT